MSTSLSRFQIVEGNPPHLPHKCSVCGSISGTFIDFGLDLEFYGTVYLCVDNCIKQLTHELGYATPKQRALYQESESRLRKENNDLRDRLDVMEHGMAALRRIDSYRTDDGGSTGNPGMANNQEGSSQPDGDDGATATEYGSHKQDSERRSPDVLSDDGISSLFGSAGV